MHSASDNSKSTSPWWILTALLWLLPPIAALAQTVGDGFTQDFFVDKAALTSIGRNPYFILEPGYVLVLADGDEQLRITVLDEVSFIDGVETRIVEERETDRGKLVEVSRNFFAISNRTNSVYYFGEDVDIYRGGAIVGHEGSWRSGEKGARFGLLMPGTALLGARFYQEIAPGIAMDRAEVMDFNALVTAPAGGFRNCLRIKETTPLEPEALEYKIYARDIGLIQDSNLKLVHYSHEGRRQ